MDLLTLNLKGVLLALVFAFVYLILGGGLGFYFILTMLLFLVLSALATYFGYKQKTALGLSQKPRGVKNVLANGLPSIIMVFLFYLFRVLGNIPMMLLSIIGFLASVAAITSDKFSSEIGVLDGTPKMLFSSRKVRKGTSGGMTWLGTIMGFIGALLVALMALFMAKPLGAFNSVYAFTSTKAIISITLGGFVGGIVDSIFGYYEEKGIGNKYTSNFICGIAGGLLAMLLFVLI